MTANILAVILFAFAVMCFFQGMPSRRFVAYIIAITELLHYLLFNDSEGLLYYGSAALFDLLAIMMIAHLAIPTSLAKQVLFICSASIVMNYAGFVLWISYLSPSLYNWGFVVLNLCTIICLIKREPGHGRQATDNSSDSKLYRYSYFSR